MQQRHRVQSDAGEEDCAVSLGQNGQRGKDIERRLCTDEQLGIRADRCEGAQRMSTARSPWALDDGARNRAH